MDRMTWLLLLAVGILVPVATQAADQCVACHTDPAKLQVLIQPPAEIAQEEGEG
ncbi:MAG: hypothetical protein HY535_03420 [Chloroflexi bacterium]|nr:hypothetical protein [Chloroflexota bacterium]MBI4561149.1 hypothetical protein [Candidatus Rokubacteria bacterium]